MLIFHSILRVYIILIQLIFSSFSSLIFSSRNFGVCVSVDLLDCHMKLSLIFRIVVLCDQFFVLHTLSVLFEISVVPLKTRGWANGKSKCVR